jgi:Zinc-finger of C2H2 type/Zinc finger, C2H2 type
MNESTTNESSTTLADAERKQEASSDVEERENRRPRREIKRKYKISAQDVSESPVKKKQKRFRCTKCTKERRFSTQKQLNRHLQQVHMRKSTQSIICEICSATLKSEVYYQRHKASRHPETPKIYICDFDGCTFTAKDYIRIHMERHKVHQVLTCTICQKSYISKHTFRRHLKMVCCCSPCSAFIFI